MNTTIDEEIILTIDMSGLFGFVMFMVVIYACPAVSEVVGFFLGGLFFFWYITSQSLLFRFAGRNIFTNSLLDFMIFHAVAYFFYQFTAFLSIFQFRRALSKDRLLRQWLTSPDGILIFLEMKLILFSLLVLMLMISAALALWFIIPPLDFQQESTLTSDLLKVILAIQVLLTYELRKVNLLIYNGAIARKRYLGYAFVFNLVISIIVIENEIPLAAFVLVATTGIFLYLGLFWVVFEAIFPDQEEQKNFHDKLNKMKRANYRVATGRMSDKERVKFLQNHAAEWKTAQENF